MRKLLLPIVCLFLLSSCGKDEEVTKTEIPTKQGVKLSFTDNRTLTTGEVIEEAYKMHLVTIWKEKGRDYEFKSIFDLEYAYDNIEKKSIKYDYGYLDIYSKTIDLPEGKYFINVITDDKGYPEFGHSSTHFTVEKGKYLELKKNISNMTSLNEAEW